MSKLTVNYRGLVVATFAIDPSNPEHGDTVTFSESSPSGNKAVFLKSVKENDKSGNFTAEYVSPESAAKFVNFFHILNKTNKDTSALFIVHGFNVPPASAMNNVKDKWQRFTDKGLKYHPVPVIWPCNDEGNYMYRTAQGDPAQSAGQDLRALVDGIPNDLFPRKSLLMHSMGNHVVFNGACGIKAETDETVIVTSLGVQFENIFMVSADVPHDIFWRNSWDYDNACIDKERRKRLYGQKEQKASNFFKMLKVDGSNNPKPIGKIYVVHYPWDKALMGSATPFANNETRLGSVGHMKNGADKVRFDMKDYVEDYNISSKITWFGGDDDLLKHSYEFEAAAIEFYFSKDIGNPEV